MTINDLSLQAFFQENKNKRTVEINPNSAETFLYELKIGERFKENIPDRFRNQDPIESVVDVRPITTLL